MEGEELHDLSTDPGQTTNVAAQYPEVVARMRAHYEQWWEELGPEVERREPVVVGSEQENPARLCEVDWAGPIHWYQTQIRGLCNDNGEAHLINGRWEIEVARSGEYEFALRRWPAEVQVPVNGSLPALIPTDTAWCEVPRPEEYKEIWAWIAALPPTGQLATRCQGPLCCR